MCENDFLWLFDEAGNCVHKDFLPLHFVDIFMGILIFIGNIFATIAGLGGGSFFIPIYILLGNFQTYYAVPLAAITIAGSSLARISFLVFQRRNGKFLIDYQSLLILVPFDLNMTFIGFILNTLAPSIVVLISIISILTIVAAKTFHQGVVTHRKELADGECGEPPENESVMRPIKDCLALAAIFAIFIGATMIRSLADKCSWEWWGIYGIQFVVLTIVGTAIAGYLWKYEKWPAKKLVSYTIAGNMTGIVATYIGLGGGIFINPFLLHNGLDAKVVSATGSTFTFFASTGSTLQYIFSDRILIGYSIYFFFVGLLSAILGILILRKVQKGAIIVFSAAGVITASTIALTISGIVNFKSTEKMLC